MHDMCARLLAAALAVAVSTTVASAQDAQIGRGKRIVEQNCARCHAVAQAGDSPLKRAPPFRDLSRRYPLESLAEALAEGIVTGHNEMPMFRFMPDEIDAILSYIGSISKR